jgi:hypothetical protein
MSGSGRRRLRGWTGALFGRGAPVAGWPKMGGGGGEGYIFPIGACSSWSIRIFRSYFLLFTEKNSTTLVTLQPILHCDLITHRLLAPACLDTRAMRLNYRPIRPNFGF